MNTGFSIVVFGWYPNQYLQDAFRGIAAYCRKFGSFQFLLGDSGDIDPPHVHELGKIDGAIVYTGIGDVWTEPPPWAKDVPVVSLAEAGSSVTPWQVMPDNTSAGRLVAEEFLRRAFRHLAYCPLYDEPWDRERRDAFCEFAKRNGAETYVYPRAHSEVWGQFNREWKGHLGDWLASLPKPVAIMGAADMRARHVLLAASTKGLKVPEEVAVIGVDNQSWGELSPAALSSVELDGYRAGYESAQMLHQLMEGQTVPMPIIRIPPRRFIVRQSSDVLAIDDPDVISAVHFIAQRATAGIDVQQVVDAVPLSRRALERRFHRLLHCSILDKIRAVQIDRAKILLSGEPIAMERVARLSGFDSAKALGQAFGRITGIAPTAYRRAAARRDTEFGQT